MCGIIAYTGKREALPVLLDGLYRLEYRGYDSAGVAVMDAENKIQCVRAAGRVNELASLASQKTIPGYCGIAHTRWATHGAPSVINAHPHTDCGKNIFVVHNGIIENHMHLTEALKRESHVFSSETDTEVLAHLIERVITAKQGSILLEDAVAEALRHVQGSYGIAVIAKSDPGKIVVSRRGSPLLLGVGDGEFFAASDTAALVRYTRRVVYLDDNELGILTPSGYEVRNLRKKPVTKSIELFTGSLQDVEKGGFDHFMAKEIFESPDVIRNALRGRVLYRDGSVKLDALDNASDEFADIQRIVIVSCGTSYYAGLAGKYMLEELTGIPVEVVYASEFRYAFFPLTKHTLVIAVSQSGETADTLEAMREAKRKGALTLGIVNVVGSSIAREAGRGIYNYAGPEISVASTKAFISQLTVFALISIWLGRQRHMSLEAGQEILRELQQLPNKAARILARSSLIAELAEKFAANNNFLFLGRTHNWPTALEGALKLKEVSYVHAEGLAAGEIKHGPIALITEHFPSIVIAPNDSVYEKMVSTIREIKARHGKVIVIATEGNEEIKKIADETFLIPQTLSMLSPILTVIPLQLFAYHVARARGCDIDKPRNLAKSVTVE